MAKWWYTKEKREKEESRSRSNNYLIFIGVVGALYFLGDTFEGFLISLLWVFFCFYDYNSNLRTDRLHVIIDKLDELIEISRNNRNF